MALVQRVFTLTGLLERYATFASARIALVLGRWAALLYGARVFAPEDFAKIAAMLSAVEILRALGDVGADSFIYARLGPADRPLSRVVKAAMLLRGVLSAATFAIGLIVCTWWLSDNRTLMLFALIPATVVQATAVALLQKRARRGSLMTLVLLTFIASAAVVVTVLTQSPGLLATVVLLITPDLAAAAVASALAWRPLRELFRLRAASLRRATSAIARKLAQTGAVTVLVMAYTRLDVLVVLPLVGAAAQGAYSAGFRLIEPFFLLFAIASVALLAELGSQDIARAQRLGRRLANSGLAALILALVPAALAAAMLGYLISGWVVKLGEAASLLAAIFAASLPFRIINILSSALLQRLGHFHRVTQAAIINSVVTFGFAFLLAATVGAVGVAAAALLGEAVNAAVQRRALRSVLLTPAAVKSADSP